MQADTHCPPTLVLSHPQHALRVRFEWRGDRYDHTVESDTDALKTRDDRPDGAWPESPPIQQLSLEQINEHQVALGVGCAGTSHWSVSIEPTTAGFRFDWACHAKQTPDHLGSRYHRVPGFSLETNGDTELTSDEGSVSLLPSQTLNAAGTYRWQYTISR